MGARVRGDACALRRLASICRKDVMGAVSRCRKDIIPCSRYGQRTLNSYLKLKLEHSHHFQHGGEFRIILGRKRVVEALPTKARSLRDL